MHREPLGNWFRNHLEKVTPGTTSNRRFGVPGIPWQRVPDAPSLLEKFPALDQLTEGLENLLALATNLLADLILREGHATRSGNDAPDIDLDQIQGIGRFHGRPNKLP